MKKTFKIKLDTEITIDFNTYGLSDAEKRGGYETRKLIIDYLLDHNGIEEFEIAEKCNGNSLFESIAQVVRAEIDYVLANKKNFEYSF